MLTLALDTTTRTVALALVDDDRILAELYLDLGRHHAEVLLPALETICRLSGRTPRHVDLVACTTGPGSFTGVRLGVSTLKGLGVALNKPLVGVSTLEALAMNVMPSRERVCSLLDAQRNQVYAGLFRTDEEGFPEPVAEASLVDLESFLRDFDGVALFLGEGVIRYRPYIVERLASRARFAGSLQNGIRAAAVAMIGQRRFQQGRAEDAFSLLPCYMRVSEAERNRSGGGGGGADKG